MSILLAVTAYGAPLICPGHVVGLSCPADLGDGPEEFLLASVEPAGAGVDVITPGSLSAAEP